MPDKVSAKVIVVVPIRAAVEKQGTNRQKQQNQQEVAEKLHIVSGNSRAKIQFFVKLLLITAIKPSAASLLLPVKILKADNSNDVGYRRGN